MFYQAKRDLLKNKIILITGAGDGIGREAAITYSKYGASVILVGRTLNKLNAVKKNIAEAGNPEAYVLVIDLLSPDPESYKSAALHLSYKISRLDGLLNNAAILGDIAPMIQQNPTRWCEVISVNVNGTFMLTQALLPLLLKKRGSSLIFSTSSVGRKGRANWGSYSVSKFATEGMMQIISEEYPASILRVNCINPGATRTKMRTAAYPKDNPKTLLPKDIMPIYLYLMGDDSREISGVSFDAQCDCKSNTKH
ncbi:dehydrogenase of unknown specificity, short-chain alcohol dehydrogenase like protein [secondary endosymbiont of Heteropsylla cubana]|uniref:YciK family oxidoreductase n=1 Tax=secondary endosymbiont of Heteropsylla cubana TaxID=134287 RepID=J3VUI3_9ENTR|nr:YciK family oxidoreductase [secondary endosymbiont of Heteropsylla cubana]AFP85826.1 dehydrogenase of unknown specificity, short-chain alcohol dehydrogenase like protein [secondary endosymbiont of Heteropsylla cubana]